MTYEENGLRQRAQEAVRWFLEADDAWKRSGSDSILGVARRIALEEMKSVVSRWLTEPEVAALVESLGMKVPNAPQKRQDPVPSYGRLGDPGEPGFNPRELLPPK